jgi:hypothetical protein
MANAFLAYASGNDFHETVIKESAAAASSQTRKVIPWSEKDTSGQDIQKSVETWIDDADAFVGDISVVNMNVTYEIGYAVGLGKPVRLIRSDHCDYSKVKEIGLLSSLGHDVYDFQPKLTRILGWKEITPRWQPAHRNKDQPVFILYPPTMGEIARRAISSVKKIAKYKFRGFNPAEISRLNASEAFEDTAASFGVIVFWVDGTDAAALQNNQRASFIYGLARGLDIPAVLIAHKKALLPVDLEESASRWDRLEDIDQLIGQLRDLIADTLVSFIDESASSDFKALAALNFGDPVAENEQSQLREVFVENDAFGQAMSGQAHVLVGRKGSGKSAIFLRVRDKSRANKQNIVVDLMPEGHQLIKLKEFILDKLSLGNRKEVIAAFWQYVLWLEIAYKILEKDELKARNDSELGSRYALLETLYRKRVDTGEGDFSERLKLLSENIISRFADIVTIDDTLKSSEVLQIVYGEDIRELRDVVLSYLRLKGFVLFLFDNLDRIWTPGGFTDDDAVILVGLAEAMQDISRRFSKKAYEFRWVLFIRSDVYEFLIAGMADYGKLSTHSIEWSDRAQLIALFNRRMVSSVDGTQLQFDAISVPVVDGRKTVEFLIDGSIMRPRYLIRLFETARRRALTLNRKKINEDDYRFALSELGWQCLEDLDREIVDLVSNAKHFLFEVLEHRDDLTPAKLKYIAAKSITDQSEIARLIDVMIWSGCLGVRSNSGDKYIFNSGYKRQYLSSLIRADDAPLVIHPTLRAAIE